ncbi:hypothetical protein [Micromonospora fluostatini]|uniref:hypothetical protein n=1 Tax=Micromonospora sp. JCM 30529 TaxID=3421643 RepID=UPI003D177BE0
MPDQEFHCDTCGSVQRFEVPPCRDGHGADCPERACTRCGAALLLGAPPGPAPRPAARRHRPTGSPVGSRPRATTRRGSPRHAA